MRNIYIVLLISLLGFSTTSVAQTIKGTISDSNTKETLIGVNILLDAFSGTASDIDGNYTLNATNCFSSVPLASAIPRNELVVITGLSGSGKSSLAFDTIYAEGQRRYIETFSAYARQFLGNLERPKVDKITGLSPVIAIEQKTTSKKQEGTNNKYGGLQYVSMPYFRSKTIAVMLHQEAISRLMK